MGEQWVTPAYAVGAMMTHRVRLEGYLPPLMKRAKNTVSAGALGNGMECMKRHIFLCTPFGELARKVL